jgi:integrase
MKITKRGGSWQASVQHGKKRIRLSFRTEQEARVWAAEAELAIAKGIAPQTRPSAPGTTQSGRTLLELYRVTHETRWSSCWSTAMSDLGNKVVQEIGADTLIDEIDFGRIASWISDLKARSLSQSTVNRRLAALSSMFTTAVSLGWMKEKPKIPFGKERKRERRYLTHDEEEEILERLRGTREWGLAVVAADTGLRLGELLNLKWRNVRPDSVTVEKSKNGNPRTVPLTSRSREILSSMPRDREGPFARMDRFECSRKYKAAVLSAGIADDSVVFHSLRHTCASRLVTMGVDIMRVKTWMGHKSISTTMIYAHLAPNSLSDIVTRLDDCTRHKLLCDGRDTSCVKMTQNRAS